MLCLSGVSIEFLCFPRPEEPIEHVMSCLQALYTLLDSPCAKTNIAEDQVKAEMTDEMMVYVMKPCGIICVCNIGNNICSFETLLLFLKNTVSVGKFQIQLTERVSIVWCLQLIANMFFLNKLTGYKQWSMFILRLQWLLHGSSSSEIFTSD